MGQVPSIGVFPAANTHPVIWNMFIQTLPNYKFFGWWNFIKLH